MFENLGRTVGRIPRTVIIAWAALVAVAMTISLGTLGGGSVFDRTSSGAPVVPEAESTRGYEFLETHAPRAHNLTLLVTDTDATEIPAGVRAAINSTLPSLTSDTNVLDVFHPFLFDTEDEIGAQLADSLTADDGSGFVVIVELVPGLDDDAAAESIAHIRTELSALGTEIEDLLPGSTAIVGGESELIDAIVGQIQRDLIRGEAIALPIAMLLMVFVFGGFLAAALPLLGAIASIGTGLGALYVLTGFADVDATVINVIIVLSIGLSVDYGLLIVSRFREELARLQSDGGLRRRQRRGRRSSADVAYALRITMNTAGRTVFYSGLTIAACVLTLMVFSPTILRVIGAGASIAIAIATLTALTLIPALLGLIGDKLGKPGLLSKIPGVRTIARHTADVTHDEGVFSRLAGWVQKRSIIVIVACTAILMVLASPLMGIQMRNSTIELLPASHPQSVFYSTLSEQYPQTYTPPVQAVLVEATTVEANQWVREANEFDSVEQATILSATPEFTIIGIDPDVDWESSAEQRERDNRAAVQDLRAIDIGETTSEHYEALVIGVHAQSLDFVEALAEGAPLAILIIVVVTFILLFLMTGSLVIPVKALLTNGLSLLATLGILTWIFQGGHLSGLLGFTPVGGIETYVVALVVAFTFGLSMDYEVFLLARIKEFRDSGMNTSEAVRLGLQRTGRIITAAAAVMAVVFMGFASGQLLVIKEVGVALAIAVILDATLVRMLLVPATMTVLGRWNWWAPGPLRKVHNRFGIHH